MDDLATAVEMLLTITRTEIADRKPQQALASLIHAIRLTHGEDAILGILDQAKQRADIQADQEKMENSLIEARRVSLMLMQQETMLSERGEEEILKDAFEDGSSVVCRRCGGLIARVRWDSHNQFWCSALPS